MHIKVKIVDYLHAFAVLPYLERKVTCWQKGGIGNTPLEECMECERFYSMGENEKFKAFIWCTVTGEVAKKIKKKYNTKEKKNDSK